jgi:hypothetical protein
VVWRGAGKAPKWRGLPMGTFAGTSLAPRHRGVYRPGECPRIRHARHFPLYAGKQSLWDDREVKLSPGCTAFRPLGFTEGDFHDADLGLCGQARLGRLLSNPETGAQPGPEGEDAQEQVGHEESARVHAGRLGDRPGSARVA